MTTVAPASVMPLMSGVVSFVMVSVFKPLLVASVMSLVIPVVPSFGVSVSTLVSTVCSAVVLALKPLPALSVPVTVATIFVSAARSLPATLIENVFPVNTSPE